MRARPGFHNKSMSDDIIIRTGLRPGDIGRIMTLHGEGYAAELGAFGLSFEAFVGRTLAEFVLDNGARGRVFLAEKNGALVGCAAMVDRGGHLGKRGQLRWVIVAPKARGTGLGKKLIRAAMDYAQERGWNEVFLETTHGLDASMDIYRKLGFEIVSEESHHLWGDEAQTVLLMAKKLK